VTVKVLSNMLSNFELLPQSIVLKLSSPGSTLLIVQLMMQSVTSVEKPMRYVGIELLGWLSWPLATRDIKQLLPSLLFSFLILTELINLNLQIFVLFFINIYNTFTWFLSQVGWLPLQKQIEYGHRQIQTTCTWQIIMNIFLCWIKQLLFYNRSG